MTDSTILSHLTEFYIQNPLIPIYRRPDIIHVARKYFIIRMKKGLQVVDTINGGVEHFNTGLFHSFITDSDMNAMLWTINELQQKANASSHIIYRYSDMINKLNGV